MNERLPVRETSAVVRPIAARAVAICEGCPMANFCKKQDAGDCPDSVEYTGTDTVSTPVKASYRRELMDDTVPFVGAQLRQRPPEASKQKPPASRPKPTPPPARRPARSRESLPEAVAEALLVALGMRAVSAK